MSNLSPELIVDGTLWALLAFSLLTWTVILKKGWQLARVARHDKQFALRFWQSASMGDAARVSNPHSPLAKLAGAGFDALHKRATEANSIQHGGRRERTLERHLRCQLRAERRALESGLGVLASIGSTAPFVGLFGTVIGIMKALQDIGTAGSIGFDVIAGPIGEALLATGIGIAVAVPAVLAYNFFLRRIKQMNLRLEDFATDFLALALEQQDGVLPVTPTAAIAATPAPALSTAPAESRVAAPSVKAGAPHLDLAH